MDKLIQFNEKLSQKYGLKNQEVWKNIDAFLDKMANRYTIKPFNTEEKQSILVQKDKNVEAYSEPVSNENTVQNEKTRVLRFDTVESFVDYVKTRKVDTNKLKQFIMNSSSISQTYCNYIDNTCFAFDELITRCNEKKSSKDVDELVDDGIRRFIKIIKDELLYEICDGIHRSLKYAEDNKEFTSILEILDEYMLNCGFEKKPAMVGQLLNPKLFESKILCKTDDESLHKTVKEIIWAPYVLRFFSNDDEKIHNKIIKARVICYTSKLK